jgi:hypothetical protein
MTSQCLIRVVCCINKTTRTHACACTHPRSRAPTQARKHARAHTYKQDIAFPRQQWLSERASMLRYTYTACLVQHTPRAH